MGLRYIWFKADFQKIKNSSSENLPKFFFRKIYKAFFSGFFYFCRNQNIKLVTTRHSLLLLISNNQDAYSLTTGSSSFHFSISTENIYFCSWSFSTLVVLILAWTFDGKKDLWWIVHSRFTFFASFVAAIENLWAINFQFHRY